MAYLIEVLAQKRLLDKKISEIKEILCIEQTDTLAEELFNLFEMRQRLLLNINTANTLSEIDIGGTRVSIATAVEIRDTIKSKIEVLTSLIRNKNCTLDKLELQSQRDKYHEEFILLTMGITRNDLQVRVNQEG